MRGARVPRAQGIRAFTPEDRAPRSVARAGGPALADAPPVGPEEKDLVAREREAQPGAGVELRHRDALAHRDEGPLHPDVEIEQRVLAQGLDEPHRQLDVARRAVAGGGGNPAAPGGGPSARPR